MKRSVFLLALLGLIALHPGHEASAHGGGLDSSGCHTNRKTGDYHCHGGGGGGGGGFRASSIPAPPKPGKLSVTAVPRGRIFIDGKAHGMSPIGKVSLAPGLYEVEVKHTILGSKTVTVEVKSKRHEKLNLRW